MCTQSVCCRKELVKLLKEYLNDITSSDRTEVHSHTDYSNLRIIDSINRVPKLIDTAVEIGLKGLSITDHEAVSSHVTALQYVEKGKKSGDIPEDFKLILGNEIYLVDSIEEVRDNYKSGVTKFPHFILLAKNREGHKQLRELSSKAWSQSFHTGKMERVPITKDQVAEIIGNNKGHLIAGTACLGSEFSQSVLELVKLENEGGHEDEIQEVKFNIHSLLQWMKGTFGEGNMYIEIAPAIYPEQIEYNMKAVEIAKAYKFPVIIGTDAHYLTHKDREVHKAYLNSKEGEREVDNFYQYTHLMTNEEVYRNLVYLDHEDIIRAFSASQEIVYEQVVEYDLQNPVQVPKMELPEFEVMHLMKDYYEECEYVKNFAYSEDEQDRYYLYQCELGLLEREKFNTLSKEARELRVQRLDEEMKELWLITESIKTKLSSYYVTTQKIIEIMWNKGDSIVGVSRGSAGGWYGAYLMEIIQMNPLDYDLPHFRHIHHSRGGLPDIDLDTEQSKRGKIIEALREEFENNVYNIATFGTEGSKSTLLTACRGLKINDDIAHGLTTLIPSSRGINWSLRDCILGNKKEDKKPVTELLNELEKYDRLKEVCLGIEGLINKRSSHAGGVFIFQQGITEQNAMMKAPSGLPITQWAMEESEYAGGLKYDLLTVKSLDAIRIAMDLLIEDEYLEWQGSLKETYDTYLHPDVLEYEDKEMWKMASDGDIISLFQMDTNVGGQAISRTKPTNIIELAQANSIMRLASDDEEQPLDIFVKYKNDISLWYDEMEEYGLNQEEQDILSRHLKRFYGIATTQEDVMLMSMDKDISGFDVKSSNVLRKGIAKKRQEVLDSIKLEFYSENEENDGSKTKEKPRKIFLDYIWNVQFKRQFGLN